EFDEPVHGFFNNMPFYEVSTDVFYLMMRGGFSSFNGKILQYDRANNQLSVVHDFAGPPSDGTFPSSNLILGSDGLLYGVTASGGANSVGTIYTIDPANNSLTIIADFPGIFDINGPDGFILFGPNGHLYGASPTAGADFKGLVFSYDFATGTFNTVYEDGDQLNRPTGGIIYVPDTYQPQAICQDITVDISDVLAGAYYPSDLDGGSTDNSSRVFTGLLSPNIVVETTTNSAIDEYFDDGIQYYYEEGTLIVEADTTLVLADALLGVGSASSIVAIYSDEIEPNSGLIDNRANLVGYTLFTGGSITAGSSTFSLAANQVYYIQLGSQNQLSTGVFELEADISLISDLGQISVDCADAGTATATLYAYDRAGNLSTCTANVNVMEDEDPVIAADLSIVSGTLIPCGKADYEVAVTASDNCGDPAVLNVIEVPQLSNPTVLFKVRSTNALKFRLNQNAVKVLGPDPEAFWNQVQADGGIAVENGQIITYREVDENSNPIVYNFNGANELSLVKNGSMTMVSMATDASGNTASANSEAFIPCNLSPEIPQVMVETFSESHSEQLRLFPNPTDGVTVISFEIPKTQWVQCQVLDLNGRVVEVLMQENVEKGLQQITWNAENIPSGMYFVQMQTEGDLQMQKIQISH
ncbi:MAG: choice-of-anchor tandem repeat GloVer-containing protein, partial [Bacteroidota bacterium]